MNSRTRVEMIEEAQKMIIRAASLLEEACEGDFKAKEYIIKPLKTLASWEYSWAGNEFSLDDLLEMHGG